MPDDRYRFRSWLAEEDAYVRVRLGEVADEQRRLEARTGRPMTEADATEAFRGLLFRLVALGNSALATEVILARARLYAEIEGFEQAIARLEHARAAGAPPPSSEEQREFMTTVPDFYEVLDHYDRVMTEADTWLENQARAGAYAWPDELANSIEGVEVRDDGGIKVKFASKTAARRTILEQTGKLKATLPPPQWTLDPATLAKMTTEDLETALQHADIVQNILAGKKPDA